LLPIGIDWFFICPDGGFPIIESNLLTSPPEFLPPSIIYYPLKCFELGLLFEERF
jgi:hypothetical protein